MLSAHTMTANLEVIDTDTPELGATDSVNEDSATVTVTETTSSKNLIDAVWNGKPVKILTFSSDDRDDPKNWSSLKKKSTVAILCVLSFCA